MVKVKHRTTSKSTWGNAKSRSENEKNEQPENDHEDSGNKSDFVLMVDSDRIIEAKKELSIKEKSDNRKLSKNSPIDGECFDE